MATLVAEASSTIAAPPPTPPHQSITLNTTLSGAPTPVPNKHIPFCPSGPAKKHNHGLPSPPASPPDRPSPINAQHVLYPPYPHATAASAPDVFQIDAATLASALKQASEVSLPEPRRVFPWLHGLHCDNQIQLSFFQARDHSIRSSPRCLRGLTIVKAGGDLSRCRIKGAISPEELLSPGDKPNTSLGFHDIDPKIGFSVRNFQIQACKMATMSDIIVYGDKSISKADVIDVAQRIAEAQNFWREETDPSGLDTEEYNTFVVEDDFSFIAHNFPEVIASDSQGLATGNVLDLPTQERVEMCNLSKASEISPNVFMGPTPDPVLYDGALPTGDDAYDILVEAGDTSGMPTDDDLGSVEDFLRESGDTPACAQLEFPSSGSLDPIQSTRPNCEDANRLLAFCHWIHRLANPDEYQQASCGADPLHNDGDSVMSDSAEVLADKPRRILLHCTDGYTETSLFALAYFIFSEGVPVHDAWIRLHTEKGRNFFAYPADKVFLENIEGRLLRESPRATQLPPQIGGLISSKRPAWMDKMDGSLPSRILPYLYLGNMAHADNAALLKELNIGRVLSVGEPIHWPSSELSSWGQENFMYIDNVQDNGVDPLTDEFERCLEFIRRGREQGKATLVHCRVGVSRSATICIAEVMRENRWSFPRSYCMVRARRLNVIVQPHLRFSYELLKWEESQQRSRGEAVRRELEWATIAREIAAMNRPYCRQ